MPLYYAVGTCLLMILEIFKELEISSPLLLNFEQVFFYENKQIDSGVLILLIIIVEAVLVNILNN